MLTQVTHYQAQEAQQAKSADSNAEPLVTGLPSAVGMSRTEIECGDTQTSAHPETLQPGITSSGIVFSVFVATLVGSLGFVVVSKGAESGASTAVVFTPPPPIPPPPLVRQGIPLRCTLSFRLWSSAITGPEKCAPILAGDFGWVLSARISPPPPCRPQRLLRALPVACSPQRQSDGRSGGRVGDGAPEHSTLLLHGSHFPSSFTTASSTIFSS
eukprot:203367-Rhodomonas_salina.11